LDDVAHGRRELPTDLRELAACEVVDEGVARCVPALDRLHRRRCDAGNAAAVFLVGRLDVGQLLGHGRLCRVHDGADHVPDALKHRLRDRAHRRQRFLEEVDDGVDRIAEPLTLVVE